MKTIEDCLLKIDEGARFSVDFEKRTLKINGRYAICKTKSIELLPVMGTQEFLDELEKLYETYKRSVPSARSQGRSKNYFRALPEEELSDLDMWSGISREIARFLLEIRVLSQIMGGWEWEESMGKWFYQSKTDKNLVLLRQWFDKK